MSPVSIQERAGEASAAPPLSSQSVFVSTDEQHASPTLATSQAASASSRTAPPASPGGMYRSGAQNRSRRNLAHQPNLLGLDDDDEDHFEETSESVLLKGLSTHAGSSREQASQSPSMRQGRRDEDQFRIADDSESDDDDEHALKEEMDSFGSAKKSNGYRWRQQDTEDSTGSTTVDGTEPFKEGKDDREGAYFGHRNGDVESQSYRDDWDDEEDDEEEMQETLLPFEHCTRREKLWMWTSVLVVVVLSLLSIAIAVDWIDWPGDGIGKLR